MDFLSESTKIGIALSGGGSRGVAHIGILKALNEHNIYPDIISGCSAGAIVGAFYADGYTPDEMREFIIGKRIFDIAKLTIPKRGLMRMTGLEKVLTEYLRAKTFEALKLPLYINATELNRGKSVYFHSGTIIDKIIASSSIPVLFEPVIMDGYTYVDGGVFDILPVKPLLHQCDFIIGSYVNPRREYNNYGGIPKIVERTFFLGVEANMKDNVDKCQLYIQPPKLMNFGAFQVSKAEEMFEIGYEYAKELLNERYQTKSPNDPDKKHKIHS